MRPICRAPAACPPSYRQLRSGQMQVPSAGMQPAGSRNRLKRRAPPIRLPRLLCRLAGHVCHSCFRPLSQPVENKEGFNPCLPRYCGMCKKAEAATGANCRRQGGPVVVTGFGLCWLECNWPTHAGPLRFLPQCCPPCRCPADPLGIDSKLAALRIKMADLAKEHPVSSCMCGCLGGRA